MSALICTLLTSLLALDVLDSFEEESSHALLVFLSLLLCMDCLGTPLRKGGELVLGIFVRAGNTADVLSFVALLFIQIQCSTNGNCVCVCSVVDLTMLVYSQGLWCGHLGVFPLHYLRWGQFLLFWIGKVLPWLRIQLLPSVSCLMTASLLMDCLLFCSTFCCSYYCQFCDFFFLYSVTRNE